MYLTDRELTIRNAGAGDAETLARWWNDGAVMAHAGFPRGLGTTAAQVAESLLRDREDTGRRLMIEHDGAPIGEMNYRVSAPGTAEIGIKICVPAMRERGFGKRLLSLLLTELFARGFARVVLDTNLNNLRAQHVYEELGFRRKGVRENCWRDQLGALQSAVDYELRPGELRSFV